MQRTLLAAILTAAAAGCGNAEEDGPRAQVKVMTRNLYLGGDFGTDISDTMLTAAEIPARVASFWTSVMGSDIPGRIELLADEIAAAGPDLVGLQEVEMFRTQMPSDFSFETPVANAAGPGFDFLALLRNALAARAAPYDVAVEALFTDVELPGADGGGMPFDVRMTDRDVILAREGVAVTNPQSKQFDVFLPFTLAKVPLRVIRGYSIVEAKVADARLTFANSHLEVGGPAGAFQEGQSNELVKLVDKLKGPLVFVGDFNSPADGSGSRSYSMLAGKLTDAWPQARRDDPGFTCCADLANPTFEPSQRIDIVFLRGGARAVSAEVVGTDAAKRTASGRWPSDHAGVVATISLPL